MTAIRLERTLTPFARRHGPASIRETILSASASRRQGRKYGVHAGLSLFELRILLAYCYWFRAQRAAPPLRGRRARQAAGLLRRHGTSSAYDQTEIGDEPVVGAYTATRRVALPPPMRRRLRLELPELARQYAQQLAVSKIRRPQRDTARA